MSKQIFYTLARFSSEDKLKLIKRKGTPYNFYDHLFRFKTGVCVDPKVIRVAACPEDHELCVWKMNCFSDLWPFDFNQLNLSAYSRHIIPHKTLNVKIYIDISPICQIIHFYTNLTNERIMINIKVNFPLKFA